MFGCTIKVCILNTTSINIYTLTRARFEDACFVLQTADCAVSDLPRARRTAVFYPFSFRITTGLWTGCPLRPLCRQIFLVCHYVRKWEKCKWIVTCTNLRVLFRMFWIFNDWQPTHNWSNIPPEQQSKCQAIIDEYHLSTDSCRYQN